MSRQSYGPDESLVWKYLMGECDAGEKAFVDEWRAADPENEAKFQRLKSYGWNGHAAESDPTPSKRISGGPDRDEPGFSYTMAALILVVVLALLVLYRFVLKA
ncbi:MAG TPA: hypothetical protein VFX48_05460 [Saprospiraceae bacterium]|nr:hypothetical protein [Saprospiraceae bacterium]